MSNKSLLFYVWLVSALGLFIDGYGLYITSVAEPLFQHQYELSPWLLGLVQAAAPIGASLGAMLVGPLADRLGRKTLLMANFALMAGSVLLSALAWNGISLAIFRFMVGLAIGADYPLNAAYLAEMAPGRSRGKMMAAAMFVNCLASPIAVLVAYVIFSWHPEVDAWRYLFGFGVIPAAICLWMRIRLPESFAWRVTRQLLPAKQGPAFGRYRRLFQSGLWLSTLALAGSWFFMDISYYGIGLFTPALLAAFHLTVAVDFVQDTLSLVKSTLLVNSFVALGAFLSIFVIDKMSPLRLQRLGFVFSFFALLALGFLQSFNPALTMSVVITAFMTYNVFINLGPGITTYLLPTQYYPTDIRATGHGFAAGISKFGAFLGTICLPILQSYWGIYYTVLLLAMTLLGGYLLTWLLNHCNESQRAIEQGQDLACEH
jgi:MFS family permease